MSSIARHSTIFKIGDIVRVPFPFVERERIVHRPALVISRPLGPARRLIWTLMITSARRGTWPGDVPVGPDHLQYGLPVPCYIRTAKIAAIEAHLAQDLLGRLPDDLLAEVKALVGAAMA